MSEETDHTHTRLETPDGEVVMYLAPLAEYEPVYQNDIESQGVPGDRPAIARDFGLWTGEFTLQGELEDSDALPIEHETALQDITGSTGRVTAREQVNRLSHYLLDVGGPFVLHDGPNEYSATTRDAVDIENGIYPAVNPTEWRPPRAGGFSRVEYTLKFTVGVER